jgi:hypothetical protein
VTATDVRSLQEGLESFVAAQIPGARDVTVLDLAPIS